MRITLRLYGNLRRYAASKSDRTDIDLEEGSSISSVLETLGVPENGWWMVAVNDQVVQPDVQLKDGDLVEVFDPVAGGTRVWCEARAPVKRPLHYRSVLLRFPYLCMTSRFVNLALFFDSTLLFATGLLLLETSRPEDAWLYTLHRISGAALIILLVPKARIIWRALSRQIRRGSWLNWTTLAALLLTAGLLLVLAFALAWTLNWLPFYVQVVLSVTPLGLHWYLAFPLIPFFAWHAYKRWPRGRPTEPKRVPASIPSISRRTALGLLGVGALAMVAFGGIEGLAGMTGWTRRFTGSREVDAGTGNNFPVTNSDSPPLIELASWRLRVTGRVARPLALSYDELLAMAPSTDQATVDCTLGWAAKREWRGIPLAALLSRAGAESDIREVTCRAATGYYSVLDREEIAGTLIATHVSGEPLAPEHGFPARLVAPSRRGFHWTKWLVELEVG